MRQILIYGRGLNAEEYCRYLRGQGKGGELACFVVTKLNGQGEKYCGLPCLEIDDALAKFPEAEIHLALQEKYHGEVIELLKARGREPKEVIGLRRMTEILGEAARTQIKKALPDIQIQQSSYDYTMQQIRDKGSEEHFSFYPMTQVPLSEEDLQSLARTVKSFAGWWGQGIFKWGREDAATLEEQDLFLAEATYGEAAKVHNPDRPSSCIHTVMGGSAQFAGRRTSGMYYDDEGENISRYHPLYSELSVIYWLWKNAPEARYLGLCHYRRHFLLTEKILAGIKSGEADVILTPPRLTFPSVERCFTESAFSNVSLEDYELMLKLIKEQDGSCGRFAEEFLRGQVHFPNNMVIARREIYGAYAEFIFSVLERMRKIYEEKNIKRPDRCLGYLGELLTTIYFAYHRKEWRTAFADYRLLT